MRLLLALLLLPAPSLRAEEALPPSHVRAALVSEADSIDPGGRFTVAVKLEMRDGWHTYWKNPGDAGMATTVKWILPSGFRAGELQWPFPGRIPAKNSVSYGYWGRTALLSELEAPRGLPEDSPVEIRARVDWVECRDICLPGRAELSLTLPVKAAPRGSDPAAKRFFAQIRARLPGKLGSGPFSGWRAGASRAGGKVLLELEPPSGVLRAGGAGPFLFFPGEDGVVANDQALRARADGKTVVLELAQSRAPDADKAPRLSGVLVLKGRGQAVELSIPIHNQRRRQS